MHRRLVRSLHSFVSSSFFQKGLILLLLCAVFGLALNSSPIFEALNQNWIDLHIRNDGLRGVVFFLAIGALLTSIGCPRQLVAFLGGYAFGFLEGFLLSTLCIGVSCIFILLLARKLVRPFVDRMYQEKAIALNRFLSHRPIVKTIIIRLLPFGNNLVTNMIAGVTTVKASHFLLGSLAGYLPQMVIFALMGSGVLVISAWKIALSVVLFTISSVLSLWLYREYRDSRLLENVLVENNSPLSKST